MEMISGVYFMDRKYLKNKAIEILKQNFLYLFGMVVLTAVLTLSVVELGSIYTTTTTYYIQVFAIQIPLPTLRIFAYIASFYFTLSVLYSIFVGNVFRYGLANVFKYTSMHRPNDFTIIDGFKQNYWNIVKVNFMKNLEIFLFYLLLIVPGVCKSYQYRFVNEILEENPTWDYKMVLAESKRISDGKKLDMFILDLSFIGWELLASLISSFTLGLSKYVVETYRIATFTQTYFSFTLVTNYYEETVEVEETYL